MLCIFYWFSFCYNNFTQKFVSESLMSSYAFIHINIFKKYDLMNNQIRKVVEEQYLDPDFELYFPCIRNKIKYILYLQY